MNKIKLFLRVVKHLFLFSIFALKFLINIIAALVKGFFKLIKKKLRFSITFKITTTYAVIFSLILFLIGGSVLISFNYFLIRQSGEDIKKSSQVAEAYIKDAPEIPESTIMDMVKKDNMDITIFDENKNILYTTLSNTSSTIFHKEINNLYIERNVITLNNQMNLNGKTYYIQLSKSLMKENLYTGLLAVILLIVNSIALLFAVIIGSRASKKMLLPIDRMTRTVKEISVQNLDRRLDISGSQDELKELAETFNDMIDRIQSAYEQQNQFVSDASHELRTPISVIQGYANMLDRWGKNDESVLQESITAIKDEAESMKNLIEKLLFLARGDKNLQKLEKEDFLINELIDEVIKETRLIDSSHVICSTPCEQIMVYADRKLLKEALRIFMDNSIKFTPEGGSVTLSAYTQKKNLVISIADTGSGISKEDLPFIFNRFYRADKSRTKQSGGSGLGLSIAKWIIDKHSGKIEVQSEIGAGTKISVYIPLINDH